MLMAVIEGPKNAELRRKYKVKGYPEVIFLFKGTKGLKAKSFDGAAREFDDIKEWIEENIEEYEEQQRQREEAKNRKAPNIDEVNDLNGQIQIMVSKLSDMSKQAMKAIKDKGGMQKQDEEKIRKIVRKSVTMKDLLTQRLKQDSKTMEYVAFLSMGVIAGILGVFMLMLSIKPPALKVQADQLDDPQSDAGTSPSLFSEELSRGYMVEEDTGGSQIREEETSLQKRVNTRKNLLKK